MMDLNSFKSSAPKPPELTREEKISEAQRHVTEIKDKLESFKTTPPTVSADELADGVTPEKIISLWETRLVSAEGKLKELTG